MRAREREAMDRRMRRCQSSLLLSRGEDHDLDFLFLSLEKRLMNPRVSAHVAGDLVGGIAAHLRHVFIERDRDELPTEDICRHIRRWAMWLQDMGVPAIEVKGEPAPGSQTSRMRAPSMLFLGAVEHVGLTALRATSPPKMVWRWSFGQNRIRLDIEEGPVLLWPDEERSDWDAAFLLRHGGLAHAGGCWQLDLPLIPPPKTA